MTDSTERNTSLVRRREAAGTVSLLLLFVLSGCTARNKADWARVQAVVPDTKTEVQLHDDGTPVDDRKFKGRFLSATSDSVTLGFKGGGADTFQKRNIRKVLTQRPVSKRWPAWVTLGVSALIVSQLGNLDGPESNRLYIQLLTTLPLTTAVIFGAKMGGVYENKPSDKDWYPQENSKGKAR